MRGWVEGCAGGAACRLEVGLRLSLLDAGESFELELRWEGNGGCMISFNVVWGMLDECHPVFLVKEVMIPKKLKSMMNISSLSQTTENGGGK